MGEKKTTPITINGTNYALEDLNQEQQYLFENCVDLDRKINNTAFQLEQLKVGRDAFVARLTASLEKPTETQVEQAEVEVVETVQ